MAGVGAQPTLRCAVSLFFSLLKLDEKTLPPYKTVCASCCALLDKLTRQLARSPQQVQCHTNIATA